MTRDRAELAKTLKSGRFDKNKMGGLMKSELNANKIKFG